MGSDKTSSLLPHSLFLWLIFAGIIGFLAWAAIPNFVSGGPGKITEIVSHLRQIEAAKEEWAIEHGATNSVFVSRQLTPNDLSPYLLSQFTQQDFGDPICGDVYYIQGLNEPAQVQLTRDLRERDWPKNWTLPKGTIIRMGTNGIEEYFVPYPGSEYPKLLNEARMKK
jgi:hypothetical protein